MTLDTVQIKHYVQANLARIQSREDVAAAFGVSLERLRKAFHEAEGMTLTECIDETRHLATPAFGSAKAESEASRSKSRPRGSFFPGLLR